MNKKLGSHYLRKQFHGTGFTGGLKIEVEVIHKSIFKKGTDLSVEVYDDNNANAEWKSGFVFGAEIFYQAYLTKYQNKLVIHIKDWTWLPCSSPNSIAAFVMIKALEDALDYQVPNVDIRGQENEIVFPLIPGLKLD